MRRSPFIHGIVLAALCSLVPNVPGLTADEGMTLAALQVAYGRELGGRSQYLAFAARAELEGHATAAHLFQVAARAESIHAALHAAVIERLGGVPAWRAEGVVVRGTEENLSASIVLELAERGQLYPRFARYAREECLYDAASSFTYAQGAEATHEARLRVALGTLEQRVSPPPSLAATSAGSAWLPGGGESAVTFHLCTGDGSVFASPVKGSCPTCGGSGAGIIALSREP